MHMGICKQMWTHMHMGTGTRVHKRTGTHSPKQASSWVSPHRELSFTGLWSPKHPLAIGPLHTYVSLVPTVADLFSLSNLVVTVHVPPVSSSRHQTASLCSGRHLGVPSDVPLPFLHCPEGLIALVARGPDPSLAVLLSFRLCSCVVCMLCGPM